MLLWLEWLLLVLESAREGDRIRITTLYCNLQLKFAGKGERFQTCPQ